MHAADTLRERVAQMARAARSAWPQRHGATAIPVVLAASLR